MYKLHSSSNNENEKEAKIEDTCLNLRILRNNNPLLVIYYPGNKAHIRNIDMTALDFEFRSKGFGYDVKNRIKNLDVILHTFGGNATTGYMFAQMLRGFADNITFLIPFQAASAGTITCLCADKILFGPYAFLSPIDILDTDPSDTDQSDTDPSVDNFPLASSDYYIDFAVDCRIKMENAFRAAGIKDAKTSVESDLLVEMVKQKSAMIVGKIYRERKVGAYYSEILLSSYMFRDHPKRMKIAQDISTSLVIDFPSHDYAMDYNTCKSLGLKAEKMSDEINEVCRDIIYSLAESGEEESHREPSIRLYAEHLR